MASRHQRAGAYEEQPFFASIIISGEVALPPLVKKAKFSSRHCQHSSSVIAHEKISGCACVTIHPSIHPLAMNSAHQYLRESQIPTARWLLQIIQEALNLFLVHINIKAEIFAAHLYAKIDGIRLFILLGAGEQQGEQCSSYSFGI